MRLALLSALADLPKTPGASAGERPAFRRFAGKSVLAHQLDCAAHLGCERVLCLTASSGPDLSAAKAHAERAGLRFDIFDSLARLQTLIAAQDEVVLIEDGVLPDRAALIDALGSHTAVLAFPADPALAMGFERIDATRAWSGALRTRGDCVARLADLPDDCDLASSLLRIALQRGAPVSELDPALLTDRTWQRRVDQHSAQAGEWRWVSRQVGLAPFSAPGRALIDRIGLRLAQDAGGGRWRRAPHGVALIGGGLSALAAFAQRPVAGLALLLAASCALEAARVFERVEALGALPRNGGRLLAAGGMLRDGLLAILLSLLVMVVPSWLGIVLPVLLVGLLWLGEATGGARSRALMSDRIFLIAALVPLAYVGWITPALATLILLALGAQLWAAKAPRKQLTAD